MELLRILALKDVLTVEGFERWHWSVDRASSRHQQRLYWQSLSVLASKADLQSLPGLVDRDFREQLRVVGALAAAAPTPPSSYRRRRGS